MKLRPVAFAIAALLIHGTASAEDATSCLAFKAIDRYGTPGQSVTNGCPQSLEMVWCIKLGGTKFDCTTNGLYYQQARVLKAGESYDNLLTLPAGKDVRYAACYGGYGSVIRSDMTSPFVTCK